MHPDLLLNKLTPADYPAWNHLVSQSTRGNIYALPEYLHALSTATGGEYSILGVFEEQTLVAGIPLYGQHVRGAKIASARPLLSYNGPLFTELPTEHPQSLRRQQRWLEALAAGLQRVDYHALRLRIPYPALEAAVFRQAGWHEKKIHTFCVELDHPEALWRRLDHNARRLIRRAQAAGLYLSQDDDFDTFYAQHQQVCARKQIRPYLNAAAFRAYFVALQRSGLARIYHARTANGQALASQLVLAGPLPLTHTVCAASLDPRAPSGENAFLRWSVCTALAAAGYRTHDLSGAGTSIGVDRFKRQLGSTLTTHSAFTRPEPWWRIWQLRWLAYTNWNRLF